jgi:hypothetical protein
MPIVYCIGPRWNFSHLLVTWLLCVDASQVFSLNRRYDFPLSAGFIWVPMPTVQ